MTTGIMGGTYDPPHSGHLRIALAALESEEVQHVIFIPTYSPPHKAGTGITDSGHRLNMLRLMLRNYPDFSVSDIEISRGGLSYTYDTLTELKRLHPAESFRLIIGADMAKIFGTWKNATDIIAVARPLIAARPGYSFGDKFGITEPAGLSSDDCRLLAGSIFKAPLVDISSTRLRKAVKDGNTSILRSNLEAPVLEYIYKHNLYQ